MAELRVRRAENVARRRVPAGEVAVARTSASSPREASASITRSRFQSATNPSEACCSAQPPQVPKWRQGGAARSGEAARISGASIRPASIAPRTRSPGRVSAAKISPVASTPSPWRPRRAISSSETASVIVASPLK